MPQILVAVNSPEDSASTVVYRERVDLSDLESDHFSAQLVERVGWAVLDADEIERRDPSSQGHGRPAPSGTPGQS